MGKFKIQIVEDNPLQLSKLVFFAEKSGYEVSSTADNMEEAFQMAKRTRPDVLLIDIQLQGEKTGIDLGEMVQKHIDIPFIYLTSLLDPEILELASSTQPAAYLVKPMDEASLTAAIELVRIRSKLIVADLAEEVHQHQKVNFIGDSIFVKIGKMLKRIHLEDIVSIKASELNYSSIKSSSGQVYEVRKTLTEIERMLSSDFCRIHRQQIINCRFVESIKSDFSALTLHGKTVKIGTTFKRQIAEKIPFLG